METQKIGRALSFVYRQQSKYFSQILGPLRISFGLIPYFMNVFKNEGISQKALSELISSDKTQTTKAINSLEKSGYIKRRKKVEDHRVNGLYLTSQGRRIVPKVDKALSAIDELIASNFRKEEIDTFLRILEALGTTLNSACKKERNNERQE